MFEELKAKGFDKTGSPNIGGTIATASGLLFIGATIDNRFRAFDSRSGARLWETVLDASAHATPMTFMGRDGRQYVSSPRAATGCCSRNRARTSSRLRCRAGGRG